MAGKAISLGKPFHLIVFTIFSVSLLYDFLIVQTPPGSRDDVCRRSIFGRLKYQSYINVIILQWGFMALAVLNDFVGTNVTQENKKSFLQRLRDYMFSTLSFPFGVGVLTFFWIGYYLDRESVYPEDMDTWKPPLINHINHSLPGIVMLLEAALVRHKYVKGITLYIPSFLLVVGYFNMLGYFVLVEKLYIYPTSHKDTVFTIFQGAFGELILLWSILYITSLLHSFVTGEGKSKSTKSAKKQNQSKKQESKKKQDKAAKKKQDEKKVESPKKSEVKQDKTKQATPAKGAEPKKKKQDSKKQQPAGKKEAFQPQQKKQAAGKKEAFQPQQKKQPPAKKEAAQPKKADNKVRQRKK